MSVWHYLSRYVWVSRQRKQIYKRIFLKYLKYSPELPQPLVDQEQKPPETEIQFPLPEYKERCMNIKYMYQALEDVLEFYGTEKNINKILQLLRYSEWNEEHNQVTFRIWCGLVAFAERLALDDTEGTDSCNEVGCIW